MQYRFVVMRHQPSLAVSDRENFAVLVEGPTEDRRAIFAVVRSPEPSQRVSAISGAVTEKLPDMILKLVSDAVKTKLPDEDVFDHLAETLTWNFQISPPEVLQDNDPIHQVAFKLFSVHVAGADQLLQSMKTASERMLHREPATQRVGETYQTAIALPELVSAAD
jgi:hypothetical protein